MTALGREGGHRGDPNGTAREAPGMLPVGGSGAVCRYLSFSGLNGGAPASGVREAGAGAGPTTTVIDIWHGGTGAFRFWRELGPCTITVACPPSHEVILLLAPNDWREA